MNVFYTLVGKNFYDFVQEKISERNENLAKDQDLMIKMDPEVAKAFHRELSTWVTCTCADCPRKGEPFVVWEAIDVEVDADHMTRKQKAAR